MITEGKWEVDESGFISNEKGEIIADAHVSTELDDAEHDDNARLIAAAPETKQQRDDLLAAMKAMFKECTMIHTHWGESYNRKQSDAAIKAGLEAIAKAEAV